MRKERILLVGGDNGAPEAVLGALEAAGFEAARAAGLKQARNILWERPPDLILLDALLPDGSGLDFCAEIRGRTAAPIILLSRGDDSGEIARGFALGADDCVAKPIDLEVLGARIAARLRPRRGITLPPLRVDLHTGKVWMAGEAVALSARETQLLAFFAENMGREFAPGDIYRHVWGEAPTQSSANTLRVHISNLRGKLKLGCGAPFEITTTPARGYIFLRTVA